MDKIKIFVGCAPNGEDAESQVVLEYSAKKNSSMPVEITWMKHSEDPQSFWHGWSSEKWATPFSGFRWGIPAACGFHGQAIYMDSDMIVLGDLAELWNEPWNETAIVMGKGGWRFCVAKWNCERAGALLPPIQQIKSTPTAHQQLAHGLPQNPQLEQVFDRQWNNFDGENDALEQIKILHYTDMSTQMHAKYAVPRLQKRGMKHWFDGEFREHRRKDVIELFDTYYNEALAKGYTVEQYEPEHIVKYEKESQRNYRASNGFDVTRGE